MTPVENGSHPALMAAVRCELLLGERRKGGVGTAGLAGPDAAKIVTHDGVAPPVVSDGPFPESTPRPTPSGSPPIPASR